MEGLNLLKSPPQALAPLARHAATVTRVTNEEVENCIVIVVEEDQRGALPRLLLTILVRKEEVL